MGREALMMDAISMYYLRLQRILRGQRGAATAEYALILALVVVVLIGALTSLGDELTTRLNEIVAQLQTGGG